MNKTSGNLRSSVFGSTEGKPHDREPDSGLDRVRRDRRIRRAAGVDLSR